LETNDLDDSVLGVVEEAYMQDQPLTYAVGPMSDRRVKQLFRQRGIIAPMDKLCGSINRLSKMGVLQRVPTGEQMVGGGTCQLRAYDFVELWPI